MININVTRSSLPTLLAPTPTEFTNALRMWLTSPMDFSSIRGTANEFPSLRHYKSVKSDACAMALPIFETETQ